MKWLAIRVLAVRLVGPLIGAGVTLLVEHGVLTPEAAEQLGRILSELSSWLLRLVA